MTITRGGILATSLPVAAPGWYPDPDGTSRLRYFDGYRWTGRFAIPPVADAVESPRSGITAAASTTPKSERPKWLITGVIAGVVLFLIALGSIGGRDDHNATPTASTITTTVTVTAPPATVTETVTQAAAPAPLFEPPAVEPAPAFEPPPEESAPPPEPLAPPVVEAPQEVPSSAYYRNCAAARAAGAAPLYVGDPGYRSGLDGDSDGVACE